MNDQQRAAMQMALEACILAKIQGRRSDCNDYVEQAITALREALAQPQDNLNCKSVQERLATLWGYVKEQPQCNPHPDAPHGFDRNASHSADRYVCECESWAQPQGEWVDLTDDETASCIWKYEDRDIVATDLYIAEAVIAKFKEKNK